MALNNIQSSPLYLNKLFKLEKYTPKNIYSYISFSSPATDTFKRTSSINQDKKITFDDIEDITSEEEYDSILETIMNDESWASNWNVPNTDKYQLGLMPYIGICDAHNEINYFLRKGKLYSHESYNNSIKTEEMMKNYIKVMKYALKEADKEYGTYNGIVYRYGYFKNSDSDITGYVSTAFEPSGAIQVAGDRPFRNPYYIIIAKDGHKIVDIQKKIDYPDLFKSGFVNEGEILLDPNKKYEKIEEKTPELEEAEKNLIEAFKKKFPKTKEDVIKNNLHVVFLKEC